MDTNQLAEALARAVEAAKPAQEYCLLWFWTDWWPMCMTKAEWSGWMQAVFSVAAILAAIGIAGHQRRVTLRADSERNTALLRACLEAALDAHNALFDLSRKISGEVKRSPSSSHERVESLERTFRVLLTKEMPVEAVKPVLVILRELAFSRRAISEMSHGVIDRSEMRSRKARKRAKVVGAAASVIKREVDVRVVRSLNA